MIDYEEQTDEQSMIPGYSGQNSSSIFSQPESHATSGGPLYIGANPNIAAFLGTAAGGSPSWLMPALIAGAVGVLVLALSHRRKQ